MVGEDAIDSPTETELSIEDLVNLGIKSSVAWNHQTAFLCYVFVCVCEMITDSPDYS